MSVNDCEQCRGIFHLLIGAGKADGVKGANGSRAKMPAILDPVPAPVTAPPATYDAHAQKLVLLRKGYERKLESTPAGTEHDVQQGIVDGLQIAIDLLRDDGVETVDPAPPKTRRRSANAKTKADVDDLNDLAPLSDLEQTLLGVMIGAHPNPLTLTQIVIMSLYSPSGTVSKAFARLRAKGLMNGNGAANWATEDGLSAASEIVRTPSDLLDAWVKKLGTPESELLDAAAVIVTDHGEKKISTGQLVKATGYASSGTVSNALARLRRQGLIVKGTNNPNPLFLHPIEEIVERQS